MIISDFTKPELDYFWENCNFVGPERDVFNMRSRGMSLETIAEFLNMSVDGTKRISKKVNKKIIRLMPHL